MAFGIRILLSAILFCGINVSSAWAENEPEWLYSVQPGDNPWSITQKVLDGMKYWPMVQKHNAITDPHRIPPGTTLRIPVSWIRTSPEDAVVLAGSASGCTVQGADGASRTAAPGSRLPAGTLVVTPAGNTCSLGFPDKSRLLLHAQSELRLERMVAFATTGMYDVVLRLLRGNVEVNAERASGPASRFEISSPQGVTSVRGTDYRVAARQSDARAEVLSGKVQVTNDLGKVLLHEGTGTRFSNSAQPSEPVVLLPAPDLGSLPGLLTALPAIVELPPVPGAKAYRLQLATDPRFLVLLSDSISERSQVSIGELEEGTYHLRLRAVDDNEFEGRNATGMFRIEYRPGAPLNCLPRSEARFESASVRLECAAVPKTEKYRIQVTRDSDFETPLREVVQPEPHLDLSGLLPGDYRWRMAAIDGAGRQGDWGSVYLFRRSVEAPQIALTQLGRSTMTLAWSPHKPGYAYRLQLAADSSFQKLLTDQSTKGDRLVVPRPPVGIYYARVSVSHATMPDEVTGPSRELRLPATGSLDWLPPVGLMFLFAL